MFKAASCSESSPRGKTILAKLWHTFPQESNKRRAVTSWGGSEPPGHPATSHAAHALHRFLRAPCISPFPAHPP